MINIFYLLLMLNFYQTPAQNQPNEIKSTPNLKVILEKHQHEIQAARTANAYYSARNIK